MEFLNVSTVRTVMGPGMSKECITISHSFLQTIYAGEVIFWGNFLHGDVDGAFPVLPYHDSIKAVSATLTGIQLQCQ